MIARCPACFENFPVLGSGRAVCPACKRSLEVLVERVMPPIREGIGEGSSEGIGEEGSAAAAGGDPPPAPAPFFATVRRILIAPRSFFHEGTRLPGIVTSLGVFAVAVVPAICIQTIALYIALRLNGLEPSVPLFFVYAPLIAALFILYLTLFYQAASAIASGRRTPFRATVRGTCFGFAPMVVGVVPFIGLFVGLAWSLVLHGIALREIHGLNRLQALAVVTIPLAILVSQLAGPLR